MRKRVTCRVVDTVPFTATDRERPTTSKLAKVMRSSHRQPRQSEPGTHVNGLSASMLKSLIDQTYTHHPFPAGEFLNIAI